MRTVLFWRVDFPSGQMFYRGLWSTAEEAVIWGKEYKSENPTAEFTLEKMHVMANMLP